MNEPLTPDQIENWRNILLIQLGPIALRFTDDAINQIRDRYQASLDKHERMIKCLRDGGEMVWDKSSRSWHIISHMGLHMFNLTAYQATEILNAYRSNLCRHEGSSSNFYTWMEEKDEQDAGTQASAG